MKKYLVVLAAMAFVFVMVGGAYAAGDDSTVTVSANVADKCSTINDATAVEIALDPLTGGDVSNGGISAVPTINCTKDSTHAVDCSSDGTLTLAGNTDPITYTIAGCPATITGKGFGAGKATDIPLGINIAEADYLNAAAGVHSDVITITVTY